VENLLLLIHRIPYPPNKGDKIRSYHLLKHLAQHYHVHLATFFDDEDDWLSFANDRPDRLLFGHLTPAWLMASLRSLAALAGADALKGLPVVISHIKYSLLADDPPQRVILRELDAANDLGLRFIIPQQGDRHRF